ncbi:MAG: nucleotidyltransferase domain-containing protein, partial [candidate division NC10 bacterium]|nr:nucleotidyltransferase domain-containing protein [candidate division NC10 bacterium]
MDQTIEDQIREEVLKAREDVVSIVIFGSYARGEQYEDLDVLVVMENLKPSLEDLKKATMELKSALKLGMGIDLLVYSREDCEANFRDHQPLFLDIAFDGAIVY